MRIASNLCAVLSFIAITQATWASVVNNNPAGAEYVAVLPDRTDSPVRGTIQVSSTANGTGVNVRVSISGLLLSGGPYIYSIYTSQASASNCSAAGDRLDPYNATDAWTCDPTQPDKCQLGDLSGKHGSTNGTSFSASYIDAYLSMQPGTAAFIGNRSIVVASANGTLISCANFTAAGSSPAGSALTQTATIVTAQAPTIAVPRTTISTAAAAATTITRTVTTVVTNPVGASSQGAVATMLATEIFTSYLVVPTAVSINTTIQQLVTQLANVTTTTLTSTQSPLAQTTLSSTLTSTYLPLLQTTLASTLTTTATVVSVVVVIPPHPSTQTVSSNITVTSSSNITVVSTYAQPYTIVGTSTILATVVQPSAQTLTVPTSVVQTTLLPGATTQEDQDATMTLQPAAIQTVLTTMLSTVTLSPGATMPTAMTVTAPLGNTITRTSTSTNMPSGSTVTLTSTSGNWIKTISTFLFGAATTTIAAPTTLTLTATGGLVPSVVSQVIDLVTLPAVPGVATVLNIVSVPVGAATSVIGDVLTSVIIPTPSLVTNVVSVLTDNGLLNTITQPVVSLLTAEITATSIVNIALPVATNIPPLLGGAATTLTAQATTVTSTPSPSVVTVINMANALTSHNWDMTALAISCWTLLCFGFAFAA